MTLGISDWGIGGLGLYDLLKRARPDVRVTYIADQSSAPYSLLSRPELADRVNQILQTFRLLGVDRVVLASDAASTALDEVSVAGVHASGVIEPTLRSMRNRKFREVGVIGGRRTILSGAYGRALRKQRFCVLQRMSLELTEAVEEGRTNHSKTRELLQGLLEPLAKADCVVLACSNYRMLVPMIQEILPSATIVDPLEETAAELSGGISSSDADSRSDVFYTTADPGLMVSRAWETFHLRIDVNGLDAARPELAA